MSVGTFFIVVVACYFILYALIVGITLFGIYSAGKILLQFLKKQGKMSRN